jgi:hypothetical protein
MLIGALLAGAPAFGPLGKQAAGPVRARLGHPGREGA